MRILIYQEEKKGGHTDILRRLDYNTLYKEIQNYSDGLFTNTGNKVWLQGIVSILSTKENEISFLREDYSWDFINEYFDAIVYSTANLFQRQYKDAIQMRADEFRNSKIPVFCISVGAQGDYDEGPKSVVRGIEKEIASFMEAVYMSGGELGLRGYYTKEVLDVVDPHNSAEVTGCPSLFQNGRDLRINKHDVDYNRFKCILNGGEFCYKNYLTSNSVFMDQDTFSDYFYNNSIYERESESVLWEFLHQYGYENTALLVNKRVEMCMDVPEWGRFLERLGFSFSFGSRIHGNIISLLKGIPAVVYPIDSRTKEMSDYYNIPTTSSKPQNLKDIYKIYLETSFDDFNRNYSSLYDRFEEFVVKNGLVRNHINSDNRFWNREDPISCDYVNEKRNEMKDYFNRKKWKIWILTKTKRILQQS